MSDQTTRYSEAARVEAVRKYIEGWPIPRIEEVYGFSRTALRYHLKRAGVPRRQGGRPRKPFAERVAQQAPKGPPKRLIVMQVPAISPSRLARYDAIDAAVQAADQGLRPAACGGSDNISVETAPVAGV
jgi:hypothetical protein